MWLINRRYLVALNLIFIIINLNYITLKYFDEWKLMVLDTIITIHVFIINNLPFLKSESVDKANNNISFTCITLIILNLIKPLTEDDIVNAHVRFYVKV